MRSFLNRKVAMAAVAALVCGGLFGIPGLTGSAPAAADPAALKLALTCTYPLIQQQKLTVQIKTNVPPIAVVGEPIPPISFDTVATIPTKTTDGLTKVGAATIAGFADAAAVLHVPEVEGGLDVRVKAKIKKSTIPPTGPFSVTASGVTTDLTFKKPGDGEIVLKEIGLRPLLKKADGTLTDLGEPKVPCTIDSGQSLVMAKFKILPQDDEAPSKPGRPAVTTKSDKSVSLRWGGSADNIGLSGYEVYNGATQVATTYGGATSTQVTGLAPSTGYTLTVRARDYAGNLSEASDPVAVRTDARDTEPPTPPGTPTASGVTGTTVTMSWEESIDNGGVTGYDIYDGDRLAAKVTDTVDETVKGLQPETDHTFTVRARDVAGNLSLPSLPLKVRTTAGSPTGCGRYTKPPNGLDLRGCVYLAGFSNVNKLDGAAIINDPHQDPVFANVAYRVVDEKSIAARFKFARPLRTRSTFLTFDFMPTTATLEMSQIGEGSLKGRWVEAERGFQVEATARVWVRIYDASVNGSPLALGGRCRAGNPVTISLTAKPSEYKDILEGGPMTGKIAIPAFSGCGVGEDLDRLFNAAISGPGNQLKIRQGPICNKETPRCTPVEPER